jgi:putative transposon-encoded protein
VVEQGRSELETAVVKPVDTDPLLEDKTQAVRHKVKFEVYGEEMLEKRVKPSGNSGRVYLPPDWVGRRVKVIRIG